MNLTLVSHSLCPYVQRAVISLSEKRVAFDRRSVNLADRPDWFREISPLGKVPLLLVEDAERRETLFESSVILEYLEDTHSPALHHGDPLRRARHRAWIEFGSAILGAIARFYAARSPRDFEQATETLRGMFLRVEAELGDGPWFDGDGFSLVDAAFGPVFRYFDRFDLIADFGVLSGLPRTADWRRNLSRRPSVANAVHEGYGRDLDAFLRDRGGELARRMPGIPLAS